MMLRTHADEAFADAKGDIMSSEVIVILTLIAVAVIGLTWIEVHSRREKRRADRQKQSVEPADQRVTEGN